jgi:hypothetical protein
VEILTCTAAYTHKTGKMAYHPYTSVVEIIGTEMAGLGHSCNDHINCGEVLEENIGVRL